MCVCCECCVLSGRGLYDELINHTEESTDCGVSECDREASMTWPCPLVFGNARSNPSGSMDVCLL